MNILNFFLLFIYPWTETYACPGCMGGDGKTDLYIVYAIMIFILLIYIPFFLIYRTIIKNRNAHLIGQASQNDIPSKDSLKVK